MELIKWSEALTLGVPVMDLDHQELVVCYNALAALINEGKTTPAVSGALARLVDHTMKHFQQEEELMEREGYPEQASHKTEHRMLLNLVVVLAERTQQAGDQPVGVNRFAFLGSWLNSHILDADKDLAKFILRRQPANYCT